MTCIFKAYKDFVRDADHWCTFPNVTHFGPIQVDPDRFLIVLSDTVSGNCEWAVYSLGDSSDLVIMDASNAGLGSPTLALRDGLNFWYEGFDQ